MRSLRIYLSHAPALATILTVCGCAEDNEAAVRAQAAANAGKETASASRLPPPKSQMEYFDQQKQQQAKAFSKESGYPRPK